MLLDIFHLGFGRYYGKVLTEPTIYHLFWAPALINVSSIFFARLPVVNNSRSKKATNIFVMLNWFWDNYFLYIFHKKSVILDQAYSFKNTELLTITKSADTLWYSNVLLNPVQKLKVNGQALLVLALGEHDNLWQPGHRSSFAGL